MTTEQRQYLKSAIDAHRRAALAADGDRKFRPRSEAKSEGHSLQVLGLLTGMALLPTLALLVQHLAS